MKTRLSLILLFAIVHFSLISTKAFRKQGGWDKWLHRQQVLLSTVEYYSQVTVMQADYSFFSPNIASDLKIEVVVQDRTGKHRVDPFKMSNPEVHTRFQCSVIGFQNVSAAQELIARSWAARVYEKYPAAQLISVVGSTYHLPKTAAYRAGKRPYYEKAFEITFSTSNGRS